MPSSLIFAALAAAWLVVLVPMVAKRRQEVARTAESALASRVLRRPVRSAVNHGQEVGMISERFAAPEPTSEQRRYRSGRGGYDPEVAAQLAQAKYTFRQRVVIGLAVAAVVSLILAFTVSSLLWWLHVALDLAVVGYLGYLRRQVRIEDEVRQRRAARFAGSRGASAVSHDVAPAEDEPAQEASAGAPPAPQHTGVALDPDDEDPMFDELKSAFQPRYRQAVGE